MNELFRVIVVLKCVQPSVRSRRITLSQAHADRIRLTAVHKIVSNWLTQEVCYEVSRDMNKFKCYLARLARQTFMWNEI